MDNAKRQRAFYARMKENGYVKVSVYVPADRVEEIRAAAEKLRATCVADPLECKTQPAIILPASAN